MVNIMSQPKVALNWAKINIFLSIYFLNCSLWGMEDRKEVSSLNLCRRWRFSILSPRSLSSAWFSFEIRPFLSEMPEMYSTDTFTVQNLRIREQQEKNREKAAREASKRGESDSLTTDGKLYRCRSFNDIFTSKNNT